MTLTIGVLRAGPGRLLEPDGIAGQVVICPVANPPAVYGGRLNISPLGGMAHAVGYEWVIFGTSPDGGNSHAAANRQGVPAILVETGQLGDRDPVTVRRLLDALYRILHHLGVIEAPQDL
ncbi:hypothetical protein ABT384_46170, partial [Streptomyces lanatus]